MNVLIVEDDPALARELGVYLYNAGYVVETARTAREAGERLFVSTYDFVLLDLGLPDADGLTVLADARRQQNQAAAIIILSARAAVEDRVQSLDLGADDYLPKPYSLLELVSRMQAITRRKFNAPQNVLAFGPFALQAHERLLTGPGGAEISLTRKEFDLLYYLLLHSPKVLTRQQLVQHLWGEVVGTGESDSNFVDVHVKNLRRKLATPEFAGFEWIETVRGVGYRLRRPEGFTPGGLTPGPSPKGEGSLALSPRLNSPSPLGEGAGG